MKRKVAEKKHVIKDYLIPTSSPWVVTIDGNRYVVASTIARLLEQLWKENKTLRAKAKKAK